MSPPIQPPDHGTIAAELALLRHELRANTDETRQVKHLLTGNGEPEKGIIVRFDRMEQREKVRSGIAWSALGLAVTAAGAWVKSKFQG